MLETIKAAWPTFSEASIGLYSVFIREKASAYGRTAVEQMLRNATDQQVSLPTIAELKRYLPADVLRPKATTDDNCPDCDGTGWMRVFAGYTIGVQGQPRREVDQVIGAVRRCHCWRKESA